MSEMVMKIIIIILIAILAYIVLKKKHKYTLLINEIFWLLLSWTFCLFLYFFSGIKYTFNLSLASYTYIMVVLSVFYLGNYFSKKYKKCDYNNDKIMFNFSEKVNFKKLFIVSVLSVFLYSIFILLNNHIDLGVTRNIETNWVTTVLLLFSSSSLIIWLYELAYGIANNKKITIFGIISIFTFNLPGIIISGRDALIIFLFTSFIVLIFSGNYAKYKLNIEPNTYKKIKKYSILFLLIIILYLFLLTNNRYGKKESSSINMFEWSAKCEFPNYLKSLNYNTGNTGKLINNVVFYYSSQLSKFSLIFDKYDGPYLHGFYQLHYISRIMPDSLNLNHKQVSSKLSEIAVSSQAPGIKVLWETAIGYFIYDFGRIGTIIFSFISGIIIGFISKKCDENFNIISLLIKTFICLAMFLSVSLSPLFDYFFIFPLFWLIIISFTLYKIKVRNIKGHLNEKK